MVLHGQPVRASLRISPEFTLIKGSSPGFGSIAFCLLTQCKLCEQRAIHTRFPYPFGLYALKEAKDNKSLAHSSIGTPSSTIILRQSGLRFFVSIWFQVLFHRPHRAAFQRSLTVLVRYRWWEVFSLTRSYGQIPSTHSFIEVLKNNQKTNQ